MKFGLMFFAASEDSLADNRYRLVVESARFADRHGFSSIWVPERHFTKFGGLYPNPAVLHAALSTCTKSIRLNAGSVVGPLHHPIRIAEEWSVVDNLSAGRVGVSFASGWNPDDFAFFPDRYADRHEAMYACIRTVQKLWRGESIEIVSGTGQTSPIRIYPTPVQKELPLWITAAGNPKTYARAGELGANLLTHILDQDDAELALKIQMYRKAREAAGLDPAGGEVTLMLHTFVGEDAALVREQARQPFIDYIKGNIGLLNGLARSRGRDVDVTTMSASDLDEFVGFLYERFASTRGLIGTPESCLEMVSRMESIGVTELACLLDFGPDAQQILNYLPQLNRLRELHQADNRGSRTRPALRPQFVFSPQAVQDRCLERISGADFHAKLLEAGIEIDKPLQLIHHVWRRDGEALAQLQFPSELQTRSAAIHPVCLDACSRVIAAALPDALYAAKQDAVHVPAGLQSFRVHAALSDTAWSHAVISTGNGPDQPFIGDVRIYSEAGKLLVEIEGLRLEPLRKQHALRKPEFLEQVVYQRTWQPASSTLPDRVQPVGHWLIFSGRAACETELEGVVCQNGGRCTIVSNIPDARKVLEAAGASITAVIHMRSDSVLSALELTQLLIETHSQRNIHLWFMTSAAVRVPFAAHQVEVAHAPIWGFARVVAVEQPAIWGGLVDVDPRASASMQAQQVFDAVMAHDSEDMVAFRALAGNVPPVGAVYDRPRFQNGEIAGGPLLQAAVRYVPRLKRYQILANATRNPAFGANETALITGGVGGIGLRLASWLAQHGVRHFVLVSRRGASKSAQGIVDALAAKGVQIISLQADVSNYDEFCAALETVLAQLPPLTSVFHLAGVLDDVRLADQTRERFQTVCAPKIDGAWNVHRATLGAPLQHFVMFSSVASLFAVPGQASYAAANAFLDSLAEYRKILGLPALTINWGPWAQVGHAATDYGIQAHEQLSSLGIAALEPNDGMQLLESLLQSGETHAVVVRVDWRKLFEVDPAAARSPFLSELVNESAESGKAETLRTAEPHASELSERLSALPAGERQGFLMDYLSDMIVTVLKLRMTQKIQPRERLFDLGVDSIMAIELKNRLEHALGRKFSATVLFVYPTLESLADHILSGLPISESRPVTSETDLAQMVLREIDTGH